MPTAWPVKGIKGAITAAPEPKGASTQSPSSSLRTADQSSPPISLVVSLKTEQLRLALETITDVSGAQLARASYFETTKISSSAKRPSACRVKGR